MECGCIAGNLFFCFLGYCFKRKAAVYNIKAAVVCIIVWGIALWQGISLDINERWFNSISLVNACLAIYGLIALIQLAEKQLIWMKLNFLGRNSLYLFILHHLERMEISYIWEAAVETLTDYAGGFAFWIVWGMRSGVVITGFIILRAFYLKFLRLNRGFDWRHHNADSNNR